MFKSDLHLHILNFSNISILSNMFQFTLGKLQNATSLTHQILQIFIKKFYSIECTYNNKKCKLHFLDFFFHCTLTTYCIFKVLL